MKETKFFLCNHCGNLITFINDSGVPLVCCGEEMTQLIPNTVDAAVEKHIPVVTLEGNTVSVTVGSVEHPMTEAHLIQWIYLRTDKGFQIKYLTPNEKPNVVFSVHDEKPIEVYAHCNLHGLWKAQI